MRRASRWILGGLGALVLLTAVMVAALPAVIRWLAVNRWEALTGRPASIDQVEVRLRDGHFEFQGVRLADRAPGPPFVEIERMSGTLRWGALLRGEFRARTIAITAPTVRIVRTAPGELNVSGLFKPSGATSGRAWVSVRLEKGRLTQGRVVFEDHAVSPPRTIEARDISIEVRDISSRPGEAQGTATLALVLADAPVRLEADRIGLSPGHVRGTLTLGELDLAPFLAYAPSDAAVTPSRGRLAGRIETTYDAAHGLRLAGEATVTDLALLRALQPEPLVAVPVLTATWRDVVYHDGAIGAGRVELAAQPTIVDGRVDPPLRLVAAPLRLVAEDLSHPTGPPGRLTFTAGLPRNGALEARGQVDPGRRAADLAVRLSGVDLTLVRPYLSAGALLTLARGRLGGALTISATSGLHLGASGELTATDLVLMRRGQSEPFLTHRRLRLTATALSLRDGQLAVERLAVEGNPSVVDATVTPPARLDFARLALTADDVTWPVRRPWRVAGSGALMDGGRSALDGTFDPSTLDADVRASFANLDVTSAASYLPAGGVTLLGGRLGAAARLRHTRATGVRLQVDGAVTDLALGRRAEPEPLIRDRRFGFTVRDLALENGRLAVRQAIVTGRPEVADLSVTPARRLALRSLRLDVDDFAWPLERPARWTLGADLPESGVLTGRGALHGQGRVLDAGLQLREADLSSLPPWLGIDAPFAGKLDADADGTVTFTAPLALGVRGWARIREGTLGPADRPALRLPRAEALGVEVRWPTLIRIARVSLERPSTLVERAADGSFPIRSMLRPRGEPSPAPAPSPEADTSDAPDGRRPAPAFALGAAVVEDGQVRFVDRSTSPLYSEEISRLALTVTGLTTEHDDPAAVALQGVLGTTGALELRGQVAPWARPFRLELEGELREFQLPRTNPFFRRFFDWLLRRGSLTTKLHYRIVGDRLEATNRVLVERLNVARDPEPVRAERKIGLPLGLIVSMVTDARGDIAFDLPVEGRLGAPGFSFGSAIMAALKNVLVNLVTGPFHAIGRLSRQDDDSIEAIEVDPVPFAAGSATPSAESDRQLRRVAEFLRASPNVRLALRPVVTTDDLASIRTREVTARIQRFQREAQLPSFEAAAAALFARELPGVAPPDGVDEILARLREREPVPEGAGRALSQGRLEAARRALIEGGGIEADRLEVAEGEVEVSASGAGRVELELAP
jgi:hypothetical protein